MAAVEVTYTDTRLLAVVAERPSSAQGPRLWSPPAAAAEVGTAVQVVRVVYSEQLAVRAAAAQEVKEDPRPEPAAPAKPLAVVAAAASPLAEPVEEARGAVVRGAAITAVAEAQL